MNKGFHSQVFKKLALFGKDRADVLHSTDGIIKIEK